MANNWIVILLFLFGVCQNNYNRPEKQLKVNVFIDGNMLDTNDIFFVIDNKKIKSDQITLSKEKEILIGVNNNRIKRLVIDTVRLTRNIDYLLEYHVYQFPFTKAVINEVYSLGGDTVLLGKGAHDAVYSRFICSDQSEVIVRFTYPKKGQFKRIRLSSN